MRRGDAASAAAEAARGRARAGDCEGALAGYDEALRTSTDPAIHRDRGLCHESLGHVHPAIDDYRAYLTARPDAPDSEEIRGRLAALEGQAKTIETTAKPLVERERDRDRDEASASASVQVGSEGASASTSGTSRGAGAKDIDAVVERERNVDAAERSPLRYGSGFIIGPFVHAPRFWFGDLAPTDVGYGAGVTMRYSLGPTVTVLGELGYSGVGVAGAASSRTGPLLLGGLELRVPISRYAGDHILFRGGAGYERQVVSGTRALTDNVLGRFGFGYRHVFGPSLALEALADGGPAFVFPEAGPSRVNAVVGGSVAFLVGF